MIYGRKNNAENVSGKLFTWSVGRGHNDYPLALRGMEVWSYQMFAMMKVSMSSNECKVRQDKTRKNKKRQNKVR